MPIAYAAKYASSYRLRSGDSTPQFVAATVESGQRARRCAGRLDIEGRDIIVMVKPALPYLDVISQGGK